MDEFSNQRLPDLPNVGYSTNREKRLSDEIMQFLREIERDRRRLLMVVVGGFDLWKQVSKPVFKGWRIDDDTLREMYHYMLLLASPPSFQRALLKHQKNPAKVREILRDLQPMLEQQFAELQELNDIRKRVTFVGDPR